MVLGHSSIPVGLINFIYSFHMPLFFFISGYLFNVSKYTSFSNFFIHRLRQLIVPYFFFNVLTFVFWYLVGRKFGNDATVEIAPETPLLGMLYGVDSGNYLIHCGSLWFLPCLFLVELMYYRLAKTRWSPVIVVAITVLAYFNIKWHHVMLPFSLDVALVALFFYGIGNDYKDKLTLVLNSGLAIKISLTLVLFFCTLLISYYTGRSDMSSNTYSDFFLFLTCALAGTGFIIFGSNVLSRVAGKQTWITYFARNTLTILAFHSIAGSVIKGVLFFALKIPVSVFDQALLLNLALSAASFLCLVPLMFFLERYVPSLIGRSANKPVS